MAAQISGCKKFLYQEPYNNISITDIFKDLEGARTTLAGSYEQLKSINYYLKDFSAYAELTAGNIKYSKISNRALLSSYDFNNDANLNDMALFFRTAYNIIYNTNTIIANINNVADASALQKNKLLADAYALRALVHFDLNRVFAQSFSFTADASHPGIFIKNQLSSVLTPFGTPESSREVFNQVKSDLDSAILLYPNSVNIFTVGNDKTYFSLDAAKALKSRVALYTNDWPTVISLCTDIIGSNRYPLLSNSAYVNSWRGKNISSESIFEVAFGNSIAGSLGDYYNPTNTFYGQFASSNDLLNLYSAGDVRGPSFMFVTANINSTTFYFSRKYQGMNDSANNIKVIRNSELYLNRAEAYAESNNLTAALADLNIIRRRANTTAVIFSSTDQQTVINEILAERRRELCFEAHTFFDFSRKRKNLIRTDCVGTACSFTYPDSRFACIIPRIN
jgi:hypothetical protein